MGHAYLDIVVRKGFIDISPRMLLICTVYEDRFIE
jgi:uncharacterized protein YggT (Ycf19 family)